MLFHVYTNTKNKKLSKYLGSQLKTWIIPRLDEEWYAPIAISGKQNVDSLANSAVRSAMVANKTNASIKKCNQ